MDAPIFFAKFAFIRSERQTHLMEQYIVSARKYRPSAFDAVVGQEALTTTLQKAIKAGKLAHAYLFCGPRGVGKTTCARIFAKAINCLHPLPDGEACNECESCKAFNEQRSMNIYELDAASNNSVDEIRALIEKVRIPPQVGRYKVFIIDEVHMLSTQAFNAFLKTLEEPPSFVIFILATTEKHKILPTILSRCQVYDFNRMSITNIVNHLKFVADKEGYTYEPEALNVIAQKADGGMRDALSIFDQAAAYSDGNLTYKKIIENLNVLDCNYYFDIIDHALNNEIPQILLLFNEILSKGFNGRQFINGLADHLRNLLLVHDTVTLPLLETSETIRTRYKEQTQKCKPQLLVKAAKLCSDCDLNYTASQNKRLLIELTLIQIAQLNSEDENAGSGLRPEKALKPLFNKAQPVDNNKIVSNAQNQNPSATTVQQTQGSPISQQSVQQTAKPQQIATQVGQRSPLPEEQTSERKIPKIRMNDFGPSIHKSPNKEKTDHAVSAPSTQSMVSEPTEDYEDFLVTEKDICFYWHEFANLLPVEETAMAQRMKIMQPKLIKDNTFEVVVDNEQVKIYMTEMSERIVNHMRHQLHNRKITMEVRIADPKEVARTYSKPQQFINMSKRNPALLKLKDEFDLELT